MSLPSVLIFYKENEEVKRQFVNCGWFCNPETIKRGIRGSLIDSGSDFEWDIAEAYSMKFTKSEINENKP